MTKIEEMKELAKSEYEKQLERLDVLEKKEEILSDFVESLKSSLEYYTRVVTKIGKETEQSKNSDGELLYTLPDRWGKYTEAKIIELEVSMDKAEPFYADITETHHVDVNNKEELNELDHWDRTRAIAYNEIIEEMQTLIDRILK